MRLSALSNLIHELEKATLPQWALAASVCGAISAVPILPSAVRAVALLFFVLVGPGSAMLSWFDLPRETVLALVAPLGIAITVLAATAAAFASMGHPVVLLTLAVAVTVLAAVVAARTRGAGSLLVKQETR